MKTNFYVPADECLSENFSIEQYDCLIDKNKEYLQKILLLYNDQRSKENYTHERLAYTFKRIRYGLVVKFKQEIVLVVCIAIHNNWVLLTRAVKFKYWKEPLLLGFCMEYIIQFQKKNYYDGVFLTFNQHNLDLLQGIFSVDRYKYNKNRKGWLIENKIKYAAMFEYDLSKTFLFNGVPQYVVKTKSPRELIL